MNISSCVQAWGTFSHRASSRGVARITNAGDPVACAIPIRWWNAAIDADPHADITTQRVTSLDARVGFSNLCLVVSTTETAYVVTAEGSPKFVVAPLGWLRHAIEHELLPATAGERMRVENDDD